MSEGKTTTLMSSKGGTPLPHGDRMTFEATVAVAALTKNSGVIPAGTGWAYIQSAIACRAMLDPDGNTAYDATLSFYIPANAGPVIVPVHAISGAGKVRLSSADGSTNLTYVSFGWEKGQA